VTAFLKSACAPADIPEYSFELRRDYRECGAWRSAVIARIIALHPSTVIVAEAPRAYLDGGWGIVTEQAWLSGLRRSVARLTQAGIAVDVIRDNPTFADSVATCLGRAASRGTVAGCDLPRSVVAGDGLAAKERAALGEVKGARYLDPIGLFCDRRQCQAMREGVVVYRDSNHISAAYSRHIAEALGRMIGP
jgi:hypothetical protein